MKTLAVILLLAVVVLVPGQSGAADCRSELGAHLRPLFSHAPLSWGIEMMLSSGKLGNASLDRSFHNRMLFLGLDFTLGSHRFYAEGGAKYWWRSDGGERLGPNTGSGTGKGSATGRSILNEFPKPARRHLGLRELFYQLTSGGTRFKLGLQSMRLGNSILLDERVLGGSLLQDAGAFHLELKAGTVSTDFARQGDFCGTRHVYNLLRGARFNLVSNDLWETNFVGGLVTWEPSYEKPAKEDTHIDPSAADEFSDAGFSDLAGARSGFLKKISLVFSEEFGSGFHDFKYYFGANATIGLPADIDLETEIVHQYIRAEKAIAYRVHINRDWVWSSAGLSNLAMTYLGKYSIDDDSRFYPAFSNLFLGEVMHLDVQDLPLWSVAMKHEFSIRFKPTIRVLYFRQTARAHLQELDVQMSARIYQGLRLYAIFSRIKSDVLQGLTEMKRLELRWAL